MTQIALDWQLLGLIVLMLLGIDALVRAVSVLVILPLFERKPPFGVEPALPHAEAEALRIPTSDGLTLAGSLHRRDGESESRGLVLFCPELGGNHWSARFYCAGLLEAGFDVLAFDFRNQGESDHMAGYDPLHWLTDFEVADVLAAVAYARGREDLCDLPLGLMGISRGGAAALAAAARCHDVRCVACEGVFSTESMLLHYTLRWASLYCPRPILRLLPVWHIRGTLALVRLVSQWRRGCRFTPLERLLPRLRSRPVLMIAGGRDTYVLPDITLGLCRRIGPGCRGVWVVPEAKHNMARRVEPDEYDRRLIEAFSGLRPAAASMPADHQCA